MSVLLDATVLIALMTDDHVHHAAAARWFVSGDQQVATSTTSWLRTTTG